LQLQKVWLINQIWLMRDTIADSLKLYKIETKLKSKLRKPQNKTKQNKAKWNESIDGHVLWRSNFGRPAVYLVY